MNFQELMARMAELDQPVQESDKADKDYDGDGEIESGKDEYMGSKDKAIKQAMGKKDESLDVLADQLEQDMDECGMGPMSMPSMNKQQDNVSMNVSMNGSGSGGIRDLMNILRNLEKGDDSIDHDHGDHDMDSPGIDMPGMMVMKKEPVLGDEYANSPDVQLGQDNFPIDHGDDLHKSKDSYSDKPYRGDNPMALESYKTKLHAMYEDIKNRS
jgi:hypothetical protein